MAIPFLE